MATLTCIHSKIRIPSVSAIKLLEKLFYGQWLVTGQLSLQVVNILTGVGEWKVNWLLSMLISLLNKILKARKPSAHKCTSLESYDYTIHLQTPLCCSICVFYCRSRQLITRRPWGSHIEAYLWANQETEILNRAWLAALICYLWLISELFDPQVFALPINHGSHLLFALSVLPCI